MVELFELIDNFYEQALNRAFIAAGAGLLLALAFPTWGQVWLLPVAFLPLYGALYYGESLAESFRTGFIFGFVFYLFHVYWFYSFAPPVLPLILLCLGLYTGFWALVGYYFNRSVFVLTAGWIGLEWLLEWGLFGQNYFAFPWSRLATALAAYPLLIQPVRWLGEYLWGGLWVLTALAGARLLITGRRKFCFFTCLLVLVVLLAGGYWFQLETQLEPADRSALLVQPNVSSVSSRPRPAQLQLRRLQQATVTAARHGDLVVWPETVLVRPSFKIEADRARWPGNVFRGFVEQLVGEERDLLTGVTFKDSRPRQLNYLNGAILVDSAGEITGFYTKRLPVPGGEHLPMMGQWEWVYKLGRLAGTHGYRAGRQGGPVSLEVGDETWQVAVQICFEDAFSSYVRSQVNRGANLLVNISNDSWSRSWASHVQHGYRARLRAVETGRMVLRCGNTGITAFIDPLGRFVKYLPPYQQGAVRSELIKPLSRPLYTRWGGWLTLAGIVVCLGFGWLFDFELSSKLRG